MARDTARLRAVADLMRSDAVLPADIVADRRSLAAGNAVLVTGATGFLGRHVVCELLGRPGLEIFCLVRAADPAGALERLRASLEAARVDWNACRDRVHALAGAIDQDRLGLSAQKYAMLCSRLGAIYHCAANVNWALSYPRLRASNVLGTVELIRLACRGTLKRIHFSSTIAVCFASSGPDKIDENTNMLPYVEQMPLGYAQSKCVAEALLREAADRGVPVSIIRPTLISGHSHSGDASHDDFISALIQGCVTSGLATDSDWRLDFVPVDYVARVLAALAEPGRPDWEVLNLFNDQTRPWRELVLWMNLYGYPVQLVPHEEWLRRSFDRATAPPGLVAYRRFFGAGSARPAAPAPYETYLEQAQERVQNDVTRQILATLDLKAPALDAPLIERYLEHYVTAGVVPRPARRRRAAAEQHHAAMSILQESIRSRPGQRDLRLVDVRERPFASQNGIFNEISSARVGGQIGIRRFDVTMQQRGDAQVRTQTMLLKSKPSDRLMEDLFVEVASLCDARLGAHCEAFKRDLGLAGCHERELALYELDEPRLSLLMPAAFGTHRDPHGGTWSVAMEYLADAETVDAAMTSWTPKELAAVLRGLATVHAIWYRRERQLRALPWLAQQPDTKRMLEMAPLWNTLAEHSSRFFSAWLDEPLLPLQKRLITGLGDWWPALRALPQTLVHNDFNPRNLVLRATNTGPSLRIFDWELAGIGLPQHDLAELLCFVLPAGSGPQILSRILEFHRRALATAAGVGIDRRQWLEGFVLSLRYLSIYRLPLYTLMQRFRRQAFLPRVIRNWVDLYALGNELARRPFQEAGGQTSHDNEHVGSEQILRPYAQRAADIEAQ